MKGQKLARDLSGELGYARWENFENLIRRCQQLIKSGEVKGSIIKAGRSVRIGSGAHRRITDYALDQNAVNVLTRLASTHKLRGVGGERNECAMLRLLEKYFSAKGVQFEFQKRVEDCVFDAVVSGHLAVEFDEPHHQKGRRQRINDARKDGIAERKNLKVCRLRLEQDIVDMILVVERGLAG